MTTFAHVESGVAMDAQVAPDAHAYMSRFNPAVTAGWTVVQVDDGTLNGAVLGQDGKWVNPAAAAPSSAPSAVLTKTAFRKYAASVLAGGGEAGMSRVEEILAAADAASAAAGTGAVKFCHGQYDAADTFALDEVETFMKIMQKYGIAQPAEATAILSGWPKG